MLQRLRGARDVDAPLGRRRSAGTWRIIDVRADVARRRARPMNQVAIAWLLHRPIPTACRSDVPHWRRLGTQVPI